MKVVALVSGGKDSCYNMMLCEQYGHEICALANLLPSDETREDIDSYMYQTVGHNLIGAYSQCMGLPLFRRKLAGTSKNLSMSYDATEGDEVEDLRALLLRVKQRMPEITAVSCGAIRSDYQRVRVESICDSLGLVSLSYMWRQDQAPLLASMVDSGIEAVLIKVACLGLEPRKHLGKTIGQMYPKLVELSDQFGVHVCGEGGEYETLTLDCPLFKHGRIVIDASEHRTDASGESGNLVVTDYHVEPKSSGGGEAGEIFLVEDAPPSPAGVAPSLSGYQAAPLAETQISIEERGCYKVIMGRLLAARGQAGTESLGTEDLVRSFDHLMRAIRAKLSEVGGALSKAVIVFFALRDIGNFASVNAIYKSYFGTINPPSRCCIEMVLEATEALRIQVLLPSKEKNDAMREIMHVQSISRWAPSCIGPYSQAALYGQCLYISGQLGLDPPTMAFSEEEGLEFELKKALTHCETVCRAMGVGNFRDQILKLVIYVAKSANRGASREVRDAIERMVDEGAGVGVPKVFLEVPKLPKAARVELHPILFHRKGEGAKVDTNPTERSRGVEANACAFALETDGEAASCVLEERLESALSLHGLSVEDVVVLNWYATTGERLGSLRGVPVNSLPVEGCGLDGSMSASGVLEVLAHRLGS